MFTLFTQLDHGLVFVVHAAHLLFLWLRLVAASIPARWHCCSLAIVPRQEMESVVVAGGQLLLRQRAVVHRHHLVHDLVVLVAHGHHVLRRLCGASNLDVGGQRE